MIGTCTVKDYFRVLSSFRSFTTQAVVFSFFVICSSARHIMTQVVKGVLYLHSHGIIHRDLTLGNILLTRGMDAVSFVK